MIQIGGGSGGQVFDEVDDGRAADRIFDTPQQSDVLVELCENLQSQRRHEGTIDTRVDDRAITGGKSQVSRGVGVGIDEVARELIEPEVEGPVQQTGGCGATTAAVPGHVAG